MADSFPLPAPLLPAHVVALSNHTTRSTSRLDTTCSQSFLRSCIPCSYSMPPIGALNAEERVSACVDTSPNFEEDSESEEIYEQPPPGPPLGERHVVDEDEPTTLTAEQEAEATRGLRSSTLFQFCSDESLLKVVKHMRREQFSEGEVRCVFFIVFTDCCWCTSSGGAPLLLLCWVHAGQTPDALWGACLDLCRAMKSSRCHLRFTSDTREACVICTCREGKRRAPRVGNQPQMLVFFLSGVGCTYAENLLPKILPPFFHG